MLLSHNQAIKAIEQVIRCAEYRILVSNQEEYKKIQAIISKYHQQNKQEEVKTEISPLEIEAINHALKTLNKEIDRCAIMRRAKLQDGDTESAKQYETNIEYMDDLMQIVLNDLSRTYK